MVRTELTYGSSRVIALMGMTERDLGNICKRFYSEFRTAGRCSYAPACDQLQLQMVMLQVRTTPSSRPCEIYAVNGGWPLPLFEAVPDRDRPSGSSALGSGTLAAVVVSQRYYYDFALVGRCSEMGSCLDAFLRRTRVVELSNRSSYMSRAELESVVERYERGA